MTSQNTPLRDSLQHYPLASPSTRPCSFLISALYKLIIHLFNFAQTRYIIWKKTMYVMYMTMSDSYLFKVWRRLIDVSLQIYNWRPWMLSTVDCTDRLPANSHRPTSLNWTVKSCRVGKCGLTIIRATFNCYQSLTDVPAASFLPDGLQTESQNNCRPTPTA